MLAGVETAALAIPGIETTHWLTRSCWLGGAALAVCGMLTNGLSRGILDMTFDEDMDLELRVGRLTLDSDAKLLHLVDILLGMPSAVSISKSLSDFAEFPCRRP